MPLSKLPIWLKRKSDGAIVNIIQPDIPLELTPVLNKIEPPALQKIPVLLNKVLNPTSINLIQDYLYNTRNISFLKPHIQEFLQDYIDENHISFLKIHSKNHWKIKTHDENDSYQWIELTVKMENNRCHTALEYIPHGITLVFLGNLGLSTYFDYYKNTVNSVPKEAALAAIETGIITSGIHFLASNLASNVAGLMSSFFSKRLPHPNIDLANHFEIRTSNLGFYLMAGFFLLTQVVDMTVTTDAAYHNLMRQYRAAYNSGEVKYLSYNDFMNLALASFITNTVWRVGIPFSFALRLVPKVEEWVKKVFAFCKRAPQEEKAVPPLHKIKIDEPVIKSTLGPPKKGNLAKVGLLGSHNSATVPLLPNDKPVQKDLLRTVPRGWCPVY